MPIFCEFLQCILNENQVPLWKIDAMENKFEEIDFDRSGSIDKEDLKIYLELQQSGAQNWQICISFFLVIFFQ